MTDFKSVQKLCCAKKSCTKIYIQPHVDPFGDNSDVDSGNEEEPTINNLSRNQLLAPASLEVQQLGKAKKLSITSEILSNKNESELPSSSSGENRNPKQKKKRYEKEESTYHSKDTEKLSKEKLKKEYINSWKHRDIKGTNDFCWKLPNPLKVSANHL